VGLTAPNATCGGWRAIGERRAARPRAASCRALRRSALHLPPSFAAPPSLTATHPPTLLPTNQPPPQSFPPPLPQPLATTARAAPPRPCSSAVPRGRTRRSRT
jgi:hypothetical protein